MSYYSKTDDLSFIPLSFEQELSLFEKFYAGDLDSRDVIIKNHLKFVAKLALRLSVRSGIPEEDAISAANFALVQCVESKCFDVKKKLRFSTYVRKYVHGAVMQAIRDRVGIHGVILNESNDDFQNHRQLSTDHHDVNSLESELALLYFSEPSVNEEHDLTNVRLAKLKEAFESLPEPERIALRGHYFEGRKFADIARRRNECRAVTDKKRTTREGVRKAHERGLCRLRKSLRNLKRELY